MARVLLTLTVVLAAPAALAIAVTRGPYLQLADESSVTVVWRTDIAGVGAVRYGLSPSALTGYISEGGAGTHHVLRLSGLTPGTRYFYSIEVGGAVLGQGAELSFRTYPPKGSPEPFRFIAWGDSGNGSSRQLAVAGRMAGEVGEPSFGLILGDIVYPNGEPWLYDPMYFQPYQALLRRMVIWPTIGNHDIRYDSGQPYLDNYYLPTNNPQGTELYYSFDYGNAHFVCLDTHRSSYVAGSPQLQWAAADLAASDATWKIVFFHAPPYSGGTHSDSSAVKASIVPLVEQANADIVLAGHSHVYERTYLLQGGSILQTSRTSYTKLAGSPGTLYIVSGTAGQSGGLSDPNHPLMAYQLGNTAGNTVVDISGPVARGYFLEPDGTSIDLFSLQKGSDTVGPRVIGVRADSATAVTLSFDEPVVAGVGATGAENASSYSISPSVPIHAAILGSDQRTVTLSTASHAPGAYALSISHVEDRSTPPNAVAPGTLVRYSVGERDAGVPDAGPPPDAGAPDGGTELPFVRSGASWAYRVGSSEPPSNWTATAFDDSTWPSGPAPLGYGEPGLRTTLSMLGAVSFHARTELVLLAPPDALRGLALRVRYDDGFVAYLNGVEVARRHLPHGQSRATLASTSHEATAFETFDLGAFVGTLREGDNVLSIEVHNVSLTSTDLYLDAELTGMMKETPPPYVTDPLPADGATGVHLNASISFRVRDEVAGVEPADIALTVDDAPSDPTVTGSAHDWTARFQPPSPLPAGATVRVTVRAVNRSGVAMQPFSWSFVTAGSPDQPDAGGLGDGGPGEPSDEGEPAPVTGSNCGCGADGAPVGALAFAFIVLLRRGRRSLAGSFR